MQSYGFSSFFVEQRPTLVSQSVPLISHLWRWMSLFWNETLQLFIFGDVSIQMQIRFYPDFNTMFFTSYKPPFKSLPTSSSYDFGIRHVTQKLYFYCLTMLSIVKACGRACFFVLFSLPLCNRWMSLGSLLDYGGDFCWIPVK